MKVAILLSTYNGSKYIRAQLDSLLKQKDVDIEIVLRDDGSKDDTLDIVKEYKDQGAPITLIKGKNVGAGNSFYTLINKAPDADYYAFSDQDDVWDEDKLISAINKLQGKDLPALYYSNLRIVDQDLKFVRLNHSKPQILKGRLMYLFINPVTGCTTVFNKQLLNLLKNKTPTNFDMHDAWSGIVASTFGELIYDYEPHISYRQHGGNVVGTYTKKFSLSAIKAKRKMANKFKKYGSNVATNLINLYGDTLPREVKKEVELISRYKRSLKIKNHFLFSSDYRAQDFIHTLAIKLYILFNKA